MKDNSFFTSVDKQYESLFTNLRESILVVDKNRNIINCNPAFTRLFGYTLSQVKKKKPDFAYANKEDYKKIGVKIKSLKKNRLIIPEIMFKKKHGEVFPGEVTFSILRDEKNHFSGVMGMVRDISERKRRLEEREILLSKAQQEQRLRFLAEASEIFSSSLDYRKTLGNAAKLIVPRFADWCGIDILTTDGELINISLIHKTPKKAPLLQKLREKYPPQTDDKGMRHVVKTGKAEMYQSFANDFSQTFSVNKAHAALMKQIDIASSLIVPLRGRESIFGAMIFVRDSKSKSFTPDDLLLAEQIAQRAGLAIENAFLYERAKEGIRARDEFLNIASHELKTPLTSLQLQLQLLDHMADTAPAPSTSQIQQCINVSERQVKRLSQLINNLLDVSRISNQKLSLQFEEVNLSKLVHDVVDRMEVTAQHAGSEIILHNSQYIIGHWDKLRMDQVTTNLLSNALKYGQGKPITIELGKQGKAAYLSVKDQGVGIPQDEFGKIFHRFERTKNAERFGGLGMGLYIVNQIVSAHHGEIKVKSKPGIGSEFTVVLPLEPNRKSLH